jgi:cation:H+ antiporter
MVAQSRTAAAAGRRAQADFAGTNFIGWVPRIYASQNTGPTAIEQQPCMPNVAFALRKSGEAVANSGCFVIREPTFEQLRHLNSPFILSVSAYIRQVDFSPIRPFRHSVRWRAGTYPTGKMLDYFLLFTGLAILALGGDWLIRGAVGLAERFRVPAFIIGLTVIAIGTSAPEMLVSLRAAHEGAGGIAVGNVIGSNIANVLLVLALPALIAKTRIDETGVGRNIAVMIGMTVVFMGMLATGRMERHDGVILLALVALFFYDQFNAARRHRRTMLDFSAELESAAHRPGSIALLLVAGLAALPLGADMTIRGAAAIAASLGISQEAIGLTVVAVGTSLPELAAGTLAVFRRNHSVALGNIVGSNIFNIGLVMGGTATLFPLSVAPRITHFDMWAMMAAALLMAALAHYRIGIGKRVGSAMLVAYAIYVAATFFV